MKEKRVELLSYDRKLIAILQNATNVTVKDAMNKPSECIASFQLPYNDPKLALCQPNSIIRLVDGQRQHGLYRIVPRTIEHHSTGMATIECEHTICTLLNNVMFGYHERGGLGFNTTQVLNYILSFQTTKNWTLGRCDFAHQFQYAWDQSTLLNALFSVPEVFSDDYMFIYDTTVYPWKINLVRLNKNGIPSSYFRYKKNIQSIKKTESTADLCNRIYCLGYGEGVNQLNIASVNNGKNI